MSDSSSSSCSSGNNENNEQVNLCCILDCVYCLMCIHHDTFIDEKNHNKKEDIRNACNTCLVKLLKLSKVFIFIFINNILLMISNILYFVICNFII